MCGKKWWRMVEDDPAQSVLNQPKGTTPCSSEGSALVFPPQCCTDTVCSHVARWMKTDTQGIHRARGPSCMPGCLANGGGGVDSKAFVTDAGDGYQQQRPLNPTTGRASRLPCPAVLPAVSIEVRARQNQRALGLCVNHAGAGMGGPPRGTSSTIEQRDKCPDPIS